MAQIVYNALRTPDGTIIQSKHRHDYVTHDDKNGKHYMVDGGTAYLRRSCNRDEVDLSLTFSDPIEKIRECFKWGRNYDANMKRLRSTQWVLLKDLTEDHLDALCNYEPIPDWTRLLFIREQQFRREPTLVLTIKDKGSKRSITWKKTHKSSYNGNNSK